MQKVLFPTVALMLLLSCGGGGSTPAANDDGEASPSVSALGEKVQLAFTLSLKMHLAGEEFPELVFPANHILAFYLRSNGAVSVKASEMAPMIVRVCPSGTSLKDCDVISDDQGIGAGLDLVIDLCGLGRSHSQCGDGDPSTFSGSLTGDGRLLIAGLGIRLRVFLLGTSGPEGADAAATAGGFIPDLPRLSVALRTDPSVETGELTGVGVRVANSTVTLVGGGILPSMTISEDLPDLSGAHYVATLNGIFDRDPLQILE